MTSQHIFNSCCECVNFCNFFCNPDRYAKPYNDHIEKRMQQCNNYISCIVSAGLINNPLNHMFNPNNCEQIAKCGMSCDMNYDFNRNLIFVLFDELEKRSAYDVEKNWNTYYKIASDLFSKGANCCNHNMVKSIIRAHNYYHQNYNRPLYPNIFVFCELLMKNNSTLQSCTGDVEDVSLIDIVNTISDELLNLYIEHKCCPIINSDSLNQIILINNKNYSYHGSKIIFNMVNTLLWNGMKCEYDCVPNTAELKWYIERRKMLISTISRIAEDFLAKDVINIIISYSDERFDQQ